MSLKILASILIICVFTLSQVPAWKRNYTVFDLEGIVEKNVYGGCNGTQVLLKNNQYIARLQESGYYNISDSPISNNIYNIPNITLQRLQTQGDFQFPNIQQNGRRKISGLLMLPVSAKPRALIVAFHGTLFTKTDAPSYENRTKYLIDAGVYGSKNYAVLFPDYPGFGSDSEHVHPYVLYPQQNVRSAIYLLNAALPIINERYKTTFSSTNRLPIMSTGYSQGGAYGIFFGACHSKQYSESGRFTYCRKNIEIDPAFQLVAVSGSDGSYENLVLGKECIFEKVNFEDGNKMRAVNQTNVNLAKPILATLAIASFVTYNPHPYPLDRALINEFFGMKCTAFPQINCNINGTQKDISQALSLSNDSGKDINTAIINAALNKSNNGVVYVKSPVQIQTSDNNSFRALTKHHPLFTRPDLDHALKASNIDDYGNWAQYPIFIFTLNRDSMVSPVHTQKFVKNNQSGNVRNYTLENTHFSVCDSQITPAFQADHMGAYGVSHLFVLKFFEDVLEKIKAKKVECFDVTEL